MRLAIADPPYLGRASTHYGPGGAKSFGTGPARTLRWGNEPSVSVTTVHPQAHVWDDPQTHIDLLHNLEDTYDGWAVALWRDSLGIYLQHASPRARVAVWHKPRAVPGGNRIITCWEPVIYRYPDGRNIRAFGMSVRDVHTAPAPAGHVGSKPASWTRWVLDLLDYHPEEDTVDDLFPGSGRVRAEIVQGVLL